MSIDGIDRVILSWLNEQPNKRAPLYLLLYSLPAEVRDAARLHNLSSQGMIRFLRIYGGEKEYLNLTVDDLAILFDAQERVATQVELTEKGMIEVVEWS